MTTIPNFELPNVTAGPDLFDLATAAADNETDAIVLLFLRDFHCPKCRQQVQSVADRPSIDDLLESVRSHVADTPAASADD